MGVSLLVVCDYSLDYLGGAQTAVRNQVAALTALGCRATLVAPATRWPIDAVDHRVLRRPRVPAVGLVLARNSIATRAWIRAIAEEVAADAVVVHSEFGLAAAAIDVAAELGIPSLHVVHTIFWRSPVAPPRALAEVVADVMLRSHAYMTRADTRPAGSTDRPIDDAMRGLTSSIARLATVVASPSAHQAATLTSLGLPRVRTLSNVVADAGGVARWPIERPLRLTWAGRLSHEKGVRIAIGAVLEAQRRLGSGRIVLEVAGDGAERHHVEEALGRSAAVRWHGRLVPDDLTELIDRSHGVIISSHGFDNQPMIALEAFRSGRGVVVIDPVLAREFGDAAVLADEPSQEALATLLVELAHNPQRLRRAADAAMATAAFAAPEAHVSRLRELLFSRSARPRRMSLQFPAPHMSTSEGGEKG